MYHRDTGVQKGGIKKWVLLSLLVVLTLILLAIGGVYMYYTNNIAARTPGSTEEKVVTVLQGETIGAVAVGLESQQIIKSAQIFELYTRITGKRNGLQAGGYKLSPGMTVSEIVEVLMSGRVAKDLVTILPAQTLDEIKSSLAKSGYDQEDIRLALAPEQYRSHPSLSDLPKNATLEGYLYPESFQRTSNTKLNEIIDASIRELDSVITDEMVTAWKEKNLNKHQAIILASIVEKEVSNSNERDMVAQVFLKRYSMGMKLGSDPTALYGALIAGIEPSVSADTPYNTRLYPGLPPGPIGNVSESSLRAVAFPASGDYLYFVSGDDGKTYFSRTLQEHESLTAKHCIELCKSY